MLTNNLFGSFLTIKYFLPLLETSPAPRIINLSGGGAFSPFPNYSAYACAKAATGAPDRDAGGRAGATRHCDQRVGPRLRRDENARNDHGVRIRTSFTERHASFSNRPMRPPPRAWKPFASVCVHSFPRATEV
jgi:NAD(P)-dependent dehydrogenase (short-subunit alcohol dehydrogenase family)